MLKFRSRSANIVIEIGPEPFLGLLDRPILAGSVVIHLVAPELSHPEVFGIGVVQVPAAHAACRRHGAAFRQADARRALRAQQGEQDRLLGMVRARGVARSRPYAAVALPDQLRVAQVLRPPESAGL